jgi:chromosome segregation ATPase
VRKRLELEEAKTDLEQRLQEIDLKYIVQLDKLREKNADLNDNYISVVEQNMKINIELRDVKQELANLQYSNDILQVDYQDERNANIRLRGQLRESQRKVKNLQLELVEADKASTKLNHRIVENIEDLQKESDMFESKVIDYERDIESLNLMCFVCRAGIETCACETCNKKICRNCFETIDSCPFCRQTIFRPSMETSSESENLT